MMSIPQLDSEIRTDNKAIMETGGMEGFPIDDKMIQQNRSYIRHKYVFVFNLLQEAFLSIEKWVLFEHCALKLDKNSYTTMWCHACSNNKKTFLIWYSCTVYVIQIQSEYKNSVFIQYVFSVESPSLNVFL